jgi:phosphocarrier protein HPr
MDQPQETRALRVGIPEGLHMRAASQVANLLGRFDSHVVLVKEDQRVDGRDVLQILSLAAVQHEELTAEASGSQAKEALAALAMLFENDFAE